MLRRLGLILAAMALLGCRNQQQPSFDPFLGRTTVPPPGTMVSPPGSQPYYSHVPTTPGQPTYPGSGAPGSLGAPPISAPITPGMPAGPQGSHAVPPNPYVPRGGFTYPQSSAAPPTATEQRLAAMSSARDQALATRPPVIDLDAMIEAQAIVPQAATPGPSSQQPILQAGWQESAAGQKVVQVAAIEPAIPIRVVEPLRGATAAESNSLERQQVIEPLPRASGSELAAKDLTDLPPARQNWSSPGSEARARTSGNINSEFRPQPGQAIQPASAAAPPAPVSQPGRYEHHPDYSSLSGKLEYSPSSKKWKLRYIPLDGVVDDFGGSVVLADTVSFEGLQSGDFVTAFGSVGEKGTSSHSYSPVYKLQRIERQRP